MNCESFRKRIIDGVLGQLEDERAFAAHRADCGACGAEAERVRALLRRVRGLDAPPTSPGFHAALRARIDALRELAEPFAEAGWRDRLAARAAWARHRLRASRPLRAALVAAAVMLAAFGAWRATRPVSGASAPVAQAPSGSGARHGEAQAPGTSRPETAEPTHAVTPLPPDAVAAAEEVRDVELERRQPAAIEIDSEPLPPDFPEVAKTVVERENRFLLMRHLMRHRLDGSAAANQVADPRLRRALVDGMRWLSEQQEEDGSFDPVARGGQPEARVGVTALAVLVFLDNAARGVPGGLYRHHVGKALDYLRSTRDRSGTYGFVKGAPDVTLFNHATAVLALVENYVLAGKEGEGPLGDSLVRLDDLSRQRTGRPERPADAVTARFVALALETARAAGVPTVTDLDRASREANAYVAHFVDPDRTGNLPPDQLGAALTMSALDPLFDARRDPRVWLPPLQAVLQIVARDDLREPSLLYFAALDFHERGGQEWLRLSAEVQRVLLDEQDAGGGFRTDYTWDPVSAAGGDLYSTALSLLTLSVPQRLAR